MKVDTAFYSVGVLFIIVSVIYFSFQFLKDLPQEIKFFILVVSVVVSFIIAEIMRGSDM
jgi:hypothetical protein